MTTLSLTADSFYEVKSVNGVPMIHKDGKPTNCRMFMGQYVEGAWIEDDCKPVPQEVIMAHAVGVDTVLMSLSTSWSDEDDKIIVERLRKIRRGIVSRSPNVRFILRLGTAAPKWWKIKHPEAAARFQDGTIPAWHPTNRLKRTKESGQWDHLESPSNLLYREEVGKALARTVALCERELKGHMMGYLILGQTTSEWQYLSAYVDNVLDGYDEGAIAGFRAFLKERYKTDEALQKAWHNPSITLANAPIPSTERRFGDGVHLMRCPAKDQDVIDMEEYLSISMSGLVLHCAKSVKEAQPGRLVGFFYGYVAAATHSFFGGGGMGGHIALQRVLASPYIDFLCAPFDYTSRFVKGAGTMQGLPESVALAGKVWLNEDDTSTHIAKALGDRSPGWDSALPTAEGTIIMLRRNLVNGTLRNCGVWWMDLHGHGWFMDPTLWKEMADRADIDEYMRNHPSPYLPEQATAFDQRSIRHCIGRHHRRFAYSSIGNQANKTMALTGAPYGSYLQEDILAGRAPSVKFTLFATTCAMDSTQRKAMRNYAKNHGTIFAWAPGYIDLDSGDFSLKAVEEATGFKAQEVDPTKINWTLTTTTDGKAFGLDCDTYAAFPAEMPGVIDTKTQPVSAYVWPIITAVPQQGDKVLLTFSNGQPAAVYRPNGNAPSVFFAGGVIPQRIIRKVGELSGVHYLGSIGSAVYENGPYSALYSPYKGTFQITPHTPGKYRDAITGRVLGDGASFSVTLDQGTTLLLEKVESKASK